MNKKEVQFRYGGYATLVTALVIALLITVNIVMEQIPATADLTKEKLFSLSDQTKQVLNNLNTDVTIYGLFEAGKEPLFVHEILQKYDAASDRLDVNYIDPFRNPGFVTRYQGEDEPPGENSIIIEMGKKYRVISQYDLFNYTAPSAEDPTAMRRAQSLRAEQTLTGALLLLSGHKAPTIYVLRGHREESVPFEMVEQLKSENYIIKDLNIATDGGVPEDADLIMIIGPKTDLSPSEEDAIRTFLFERRGKAFFMMDVAGGRDRLENFHSLFNSCGVELEQLLVVERDPNYYLPQLPIGLVPKIKVHTITADLITDELAVLFPRSQAVTILETRSRDLHINPLLESSESAWGKTDLEDPSMEPSPADRSGPFQVAVAVVDREDGSDEDMRVVITASSFFLYPEEGIGIPLKGPGNADFFYNATSWLYGQEASISLRAKPLIDYPLRLNQQHFFLYAGFSVLVVPLCVLVAGLIVWIRRRNL